MMLRRVSSFDGDAVGLPGMHTRVVVLLPSIVNVHMIWFKVYKYLVLESTGETVTLPANQSE